MSTSPDPGRGGKPAGRSFDRSIVEGPLEPAVWRLAWPAMLTNAVGGLQGMVDHVLVGHGAPVIFGGAAALRALAAAG